MEFSEAQQRKNVPKAIGRGSPGEWSQVFCSAFSIFALSYFRTIVLSTHRSPLTTHRFPRTPMEFFVAKRKKMTEAASAEGGISRRMIAIFLFPCYSVLMLRSGSKPLVSRFLWRIVGCLLLTVSGKDFS